MGQAEGTVRFDIVSMLVLGGHKTLICHRYDAKDLAPAVQHMLPIIAR